MEGNDARNKEKDGSPAGAAGRMRLGGRERGHAAFSAQANDGRGAEDEVGEPFRLVRSE